MVVFLFVLCQNKVDSMTTFTQEKTITQRRRTSASIRLAQWRKRNAKALKGWDPVFAVRKSRMSR